MKYLVVFLIFVSLFVVSCGEKSPDELNEKFSEQVAREYVMNLPTYSNFGGRSLELVNTFEGECEKCWIFKYSFEIQAGEDAIRDLFVVHADITVEKGEITNEEIAQEPKNPDVEEEQDTTEDV